MRVIYPGHRYVLSELDGTSTNAVLQFVQRRPHHEPAPGTTNQEVCRALIDRVKVLDAEVPWFGNAKILEHLREVIFLHEIRVYHRHHPEISAAQAAEKVLYFRMDTGLHEEHIPVGEDGHWRVT
jgi:hypothetical protein